MFYSFFCLSVMSPSPSTSKCVSPPGTQFRLTAAHISPGSNPAAFSFQLNQLFTSTTAWIFWGFQWMKESAYLGEFDASPQSGGNKRLHFKSNCTLFGYVDLFGWFFFFCRKSFCSYVQTARITWFIKDWSRQDIDLLWYKMMWLLEPLFMFKMWSGDKDLWSNLKCC